MTHVCPSVRHTRRSTFSSATFAESLQAAGGRQLPFLALGSLIDAGSCRRLRLSRTRTFTSSLVAQQSIFSSETLVRLCWEAPVPSPVRPAWDPGVGRSEAPDKDPHRLAGRLSFPSSPQMNTQAPCPGEKQAQIEALWEGKGPQHPDKSSTSHAPGRTAVPGCPRWTEMPLRGGLVLPLLVLVPAVGSELFEDPR